MFRALAVIAALGAAVAAPADHWLRLKRSSPAETVEFGVALKQSEAGLRTLDRVFHEITDPESPRYGHYLSKAALNAMTAPAREVVEEVVAWLESDGDVSCQVFSDYLRCRSTVGAVERLLNTEMHEFQSVQTDDKIHRISGAYAFPSAMEGKIDFVTGLNSFPVAHYGRAVPHSPEPNADYYVVPETLVNFYGLKGVQGSSKVIASAAEFQNYPAYGDSDLATFIKNTGVPTFSIAKHVGPFNQQSPQPESTLDVEYLGAVGVGVTNWYWTETEWMYDWTQTLLKTSETPDIFSVSYGWYEGDQCQISPTAPPCQQGGSEAFVTTVNTNFQKIGANGITIVLATGDSGAHGRTDPTCQSPVVRPAYPAASPYVLAVGATQIQNGQAGGSSPICTSGALANQCAVSGTEIVASKKTGALITSGGGFSIYASRLSHQNEAVSAYLSQSGVTPPSQDFNSSGRAFPDVAALGHKYYIEMDGQVYDVDGTSCSAPVFSGVLSLVASNRKSGQKLGFVAPLLYKAWASDKSAFNDITSGDNYCTEESCDCSTGFKAATGWDATTGLGTPNYPKLIAAIDSIDAKRAARFGL